MLETLELPLTFEEPGDSPRSSPAAGSAIRESDIRPATDEDNSCRIGKDRIQWLWNCPRCGWEVHASIGENATPREIAADPLCCTCRRKSSQNAKAEQP